MEKSQSDDVKSHIVLSAIKFIGDTALNSALPSSVGINGLSKENKFNINEDEISPKHFEEFTVTPPDTGNGDEEIESDIELDLSDIESENLCSSPNDTLENNEEGRTIKIRREAKDVAIYCIRLTHVDRFDGQTSSAEKTDVSDATDGPQEHLGALLQKTDELLRNIGYSKFTGKEPKYLELLRAIAETRKGEGEEVNESVRSFRRDSKRFAKLLNERNWVSHPITTHLEYWGTKQQLLAGKVIGDWIDKANGPLDPIFGVLLQPTAGRVGSGDSNLLHKVLHDNDGCMSFHAAVHDGFGYLYKKHKVGPGYDYLCNSRLDDSNPLAGQANIWEFWKKILK